MEGCAGANCRGDRRQVGFVRILPPPWSNCYGVLAFWIARIAKQAAVLSPVEKWISGLGGSVPAPSLQNRPPASRSAHAIRPGLSTSDPTKAHSPCLCPTIDVYPFFPPLGLGPLDSQTCQGITYHLLSSAFPAVVAFTSHGRRAGKQTDTCRRSWPTFLVYVENTEMLPPPLVLVPVPAPRERHLRLRLR
ncbi:hypothetical protein GQ53DRAFT_450660 [Thozetella sp. PMI_491]|nr:hypothetical protein GQ53DRAFT_450660 [Thozetella sp. PMI_491]